MPGWNSKYSAASSTLMASTSAMLFSRNVTARVSALNRAPLQASQGTVTSGRKLISIFFMPWPSHSSQRPPVTLKENRLAVYPRMRASVEPANSRRMSSQIPT